MAIYRAAKGVVIDGEGIIWSTKGMVDEKEYRIWPSSMANEHCASK